MAYLHTFQITTPDTKRPDIVPLSPDNLAPNIWTQLENRIRAEGEMQPYPATLLQTRWRNGLASIITHQGQIVVYVGLDATYDDNSRIRLEKALDGAVLPRATVYRGVSGWTHTAWRRRGLGVKARVPLYNAVLGTRELYLASTSGMGAVPLWERLGWKLIGWDDFAFLAALEGWYTDFDANGFASRFYAPGIGWETFSPHIPYNGKHLSPFENTSHPWTHYAHLGVSDVSLAQELNLCFASAVNHDLARWRKAIQAAFPAKHK